METGLLGSYRTEEEQFIKSSFEDIHSFVDQTDVIDDRLHSSHSESNEEDYGRTLSDWQRHVGSLPIMDSEDCLVNERLLKFGLDMLEYNAPPDKSKESLTTTSLDTKSNLQICKIDYDTLNNGDNRLMDNDNTSQCNNMISSIIDNPMEESCNILDSFNEEKLLECDPLNGLFDAVKMESSFDCPKTTITYTSTYTPRHIENSEMFSENHINPIHKFPQNSHVHRKYLFNTKSKRNKQKSLSLPQSPEHDTFGIDSIDLQSSLCFEDISALDFNEFVDDDINIKPEKAFNKSFDITDVLNSTKDDILKKEMDTSDDLFNSQIQDCDLEVDISDFDLPSFIMGKSDTSAFLIDCFETNSETLIPKTEIDDINLDNITNCDDAMSDTSKFVNCNALKTDCSLLDTGKELNLPDIDLIPPISIPISDDSKEIETNLPSPIDSISSYSRKADTDDYIDVESVSDCESFPVLAASSVNALLEQFEATEDLSKSIRSVRKMTIPKDSQHVQNNIKASKEPYLVFPTIWRTDLEESTGTKDNNRMRPINPRLQKNVKSVSSGSKQDQEQVYLDHDYCFVSPLRSEPRILRKHGVSTSKSEQNLKSSEDSEFIDLSSYYVRPNTQNSVIGKIKNQSMPLNGSEKCVPKNESNSLLKPLSPIKTYVIKGKKNAGSLSFTCVKQKVSGLSSGIPAVDHSYSRTGNAKQSNSTKNNTGISNLVYGNSKLVVNKTFNESSNVKLSDQIKLEKSETKSIQNIIVLENGSERLIDINKDSQNILSVNRSFHSNSNKNSLLITNFKKQSEDKIVQKDLNKKINTKGNQRPKFSLLKPIVKDNIKMISLLKSSYCDEADLKKKELIPQEDSSSILTKNSISDVPNVPPPVKPIEKCENIVQNPNANIIQGNKISQKRKLNIEEYKKRREGGSNSCDSSRTCSPTGIGVVDVELSSNLSVNNNTIQTDKMRNQCLLPKENSSKMTNLVNNNRQTTENFHKKLEMNTKHTPSKLLFDPIADATRKALKLKKQSSQITHEDKIIKSKISNVENVIILPLATENGKLLPMIKKIDDKETLAVSNQPTPQRKIEEYDEITTVCMGVNTDIHYLQNFKSSNIVEKNTSDRKKNSEIISVELESIEIDCSDIFHSENKTIMYLRKDRDKPKSRSLGIQTELIEMCYEILQSETLKLPEKNTLTCDNSANETNLLLNKKSHRERRDSSMSISGDSNCDNHTELINRWRIDAMKKNDNTRSRSQSSNASSRSISPRSSKSKKRNYNAKHRYRSRYSSQSSDSSKHSSKYKRRSRSFSRNRPKYRKLRGDSYKSKSYMKEKDSPDNRSIQSLPSNSKRKRNPSMTSDDWKEKSSSYENQSSQPPSKISREYGKNWDTRNGYKKSPRSRSSSVTSNSSLSSESSIDSDSSTNNHTHSSSESSARSNSISSKYGRGRSRSRRVTHSSRSGGSRNNKRARELFEERKVVYVGMLEPTISVSALKMKFVKYGCVEEVTIHMKDDGMRYGFVTFVQALHSYKALENAPKDPEIKHYDVFFGGRRAFCKQYYADLDDLEATQEESGFYPALVTRSLAPAPDKSFEHLLQEAKAAVSARKARDQSIVSESRNKKCGKV